MFLAIDIDEDNFSLNIDLNGVDVENKIYLREEDIFESEVVNHTRDDSDDTCDYNKRYCPDCGCEITYKNDRGAFCIKCAPDH